VRLLHLSDLHLGFRQFQRTTPAGINQREWDVAQSFTRAIDRVIELRPDLVLIAGDVFHTVRPTNPAILAQRAPSILAAEWPATPSPAGDEPVAGRAATSALQPCDTMPTGYPPVTVVTSNQPDPGCIFMTPGSGGSNGHLAIVDNLGEPLFARSLSGQAFDFKVQPNGQLTYFSGAFFVLDSTYTVVDEWQAGNGLQTDLHELLLLPNGDALLLADEYQIVDMSTVVPGGCANALVTGLVIQELDPDKNVVFQWRTLDHFQITDMIEVPGRSLTNCTLDYVHCNAIEVALDGNLLLSSRHFDEITKIDHESGDIIWRMGLNAKNNQFTFVGDTRGYSHQHDIRQLPNGDITLFDNGDYLLPQYSRAVEYAVDETHMIATEVWEFRHSPDQYASATGSVRRRDDGGTLIGWGLGTPDPKLTDLHADGSIALELGLGSTSLFSYRALRYPWRTTQFVPDADSIDFGPVTVGGDTSQVLTVHSRMNVDIPLTCFSSSNPAVSVAEAPPITLPAGGDVTLHVHFQPRVPRGMRARLYLRSVSGTQLVAQAVDVKGVGVGTLADTHRHDVAEPWIAATPNPARGARTLWFGIPHPANVTLLIYDLSGRRVATAFDGLAHAGPNRVSWTPSVRGDPLAGGVYFAVLKTPFGRRAVKLVSLDR